MTIVKRHRKSQVMIDEKPTKTLWQREVEFSKLMKLFSAGKITLVEFKKQNPRNASNPGNMSLRQLFFTK